MSTKKGRAVKHSSVQDAFRRKSGRVISISRTILASVFLVAIWLDPSQPTIAPGYAYFILACYVLLSAGQLALTWDNWWLEERLAVPTHVLDILVFGVMVFLTEGYTSPFFTFFVFIILSALIRWGWRRAAVAAILVVLIFYAAGFGAFAWPETEFELHRFVFRGAYLIVLSFLLIWFGINHLGLRPAPSVSIELSSSSASAGPPLKETLELIEQEFRPQTLVLAWSEREEPWTNLIGTARGAPVNERSGPEGFGEIVHRDLIGRPFLFDLGKNRVLVRESRGERRRLRLRDAVSEGLKDRFRLERGVAIPVEADEYVGWIIAEGISGLCADDLDVASGIADEVSAGFDRLSMLRVSEEAAATRTRLSLARDLHDSVAQLLAGTSFRLEAIRMSAREGQDIDAEVESLQAALANEQHDLRTIISTLRGEEAASRRIDLASDLAALADRLARQWDVECRVVDGTGPLWAPALLQHNVHQIVREAVANAVRHGKAKLIEIHAAERGDALRIQITDDGVGFPREGDGDEWQDLEESQAPRSLRERLHSLGGSLGLRSGKGGSCLSIELPLERRA